MFPPIIMLVPLFLLARELGLTNSLPGLALTYISFSLPYALWILRAFFQSIPIELEQAALIDGANRAQALAYVVMPLALPGIIATAIFTFIVAWNDFLFALVLIGHDELKTLAIGVNEFFRITQIVVERTTMQSGYSPAFLVYAFALVVYFAICSALTRLSRYFEQRLQKTGTSAIAAPRGFKESA